jgi:phosphoserine phosphatase
VTHTAAHASTPQPAFAAVIFDIDGVVTDAAVWTPLLPLNVVGTKAYTWAERGR